jgi:hypothetical protein
MHLGLETNSRFIEKMEESLLCLYDLYNDHIIEKTDANKIRLLKVYLWVKKWKLALLFSSFYPLFRYLNVKINLGNHPSLFVLDLYKLSYFSHISRTGKKIAGKSKKNTEFT